SHCPSVVHTEPAGGCEGISLPVSPYPRPCRRQTRPMRCGRPKTIPELVGASATALTSYAYGIDGVTGRCIATRSTKNLFQECTVDRQSRRDSQFCVNDRRKASQFCEPGEIHPLHNRLIHRELGEAADAVRFFL